ncbi:MAG: hypothetical protein WC867_08390 [Candidatus Pacearchaeota archaeon]|jgi:hypothetical protein
MTTEKNQNNNARLESRLVDSVFSSYDENNFLQYPKLNPQYVDQAIMNYNINSVEAYLDHTYAEAI